MSDTTRLDEILMAWKQLADRRNLEKQTEEEKDKCDYPESFIQWEDERSLKKKRRRLKEQDDESRR